MQNSSSSKTFGIAIVLIIIVIGLWLMMRKPATAPAVMNTTPQTGTVSQNSDASDTALAKDEASIDAELGGLSADTAAAASTQ